jgi:hypothetical protein
MKKPDLAWLHGKWVDFLSILRIDLLDFQSEMADGLLQLPEYADITQARQSGKSFVIGVLVYFLAYTLKWDIIIVGPKLGGTEHIMDVVDRIATYLKRRKRNPIPLSIHSTKKIRIRGRGTIKCISGDPYAQVEGNHAHLIVLDEKQDLEKKHIATNIEPFRGFFNGLMWSLGIGGAPDSWGEYSRLVSADPGCFVWKCPWQRVIIDKPDYIKMVEKFRRGMMPPEFRAHMECAELDMSKHLLLQKLEPFTEFPGDIRDAHIQIGFDFGSIDQTVGTVRYKFNEDYFFDQWFVASGDYGDQFDALGEWLRNDVIYDILVGEYNGVGRPVIDLLNKNGFEIIPITMDRPKKTKAAHRIKDLADNGHLKYNPDQELSVVAHKKLTTLNYKMSPDRHVLVDHCDFYSSAITTVLEPPRMRLSA